MKFNVATRDPLTIEDAYSLFQRGTFALARAERQGIRIDLDYARKTHKELTELIDELTSNFMSTNFYKHWVHTKKGKVNIDSNDQLQHYLYKVKKLKPVKTTTSGKGSTDEEALEQLNIKELDDLLNIRKLKKLRKTYLEGFMNEAVDGYIHPFFNLQSVSTYRSSSDSPNFQNIPKRDLQAREIIRRCIYPRPGHQLVEIDYGALEVRIAACYHKDPTMLKYIRDNYDMHQDMAKQIFFLEEFDKSDETISTLRGAAKNGFVFPQFYGDYYKNNALVLSKWGKLPLKGRWKKEHGLQLPAPYDMNLGEYMMSNGVNSLDKFIDHLQGIESHFWNERFPVYQDWKERWWRQYQKAGYIQMLTGFQCSGLMSKNEVINYGVQGSAFHCLLWSFTELDRLAQKEKWDTKPVGQIHDSILLDTHPDELEYVLQVANRVTCHDLITEWDWIIVPLEIEAEVSPVDGSWFEKEKIKIK